MRALPLVALPLVVLPVLAGCLGARVPEPAPDDRYGHRYLRPDHGGRTEATLAPPDTSQPYFFYPALVESVHVRPAPFTPGGGAEVAVEVLFEGALPDTCTVLHAVEQERTGHLVALRLVSRRPQGAVCADAVQYFRSYALLEGRYEAGHYTLFVNDTPYPFEIRPGAAPD